MCQQRFQPEMSYLNWKNRDQLLSKGCLYSTQEDQQLSNYSVVMKNFLSNSFDELLKSKKLELNEAYQLLEKIGPDSNNQISSFLRLRIYLNLSWRAEINQEIRSIISEIPLIQSISKNEILKKSDQDLFYSKFSILLDYLFDHLDSKQRQILFYYLAHFDYPENANQWSGISKINDYKEQLIDKRVYDSNFEFPFFQLNFLDSNKNETYVLLKNYFNMFSDFSVSSDLQKQLLPLIYLSEIRGLKNENEMISQIKENSALMVLFYEMDSLSWYNRLGLNMINKRAFYFSLMNKKQYLNWTIFQLASMGDFNGQYWQK